MDKETIVSLIEDKSFTEFIGQFSPPLWLSIAYLAAGLISAVISTGLFWMILQQTRLMRQQANSMHTQTESLAEQVKVARDQAKAEHERARREFAVHLCFKWATEMKEEIRSIKEFAQDLPEDSVKKVMKSEQFSIHKEDVKRLKNALVHAYSLEDLNNLTTSVNETTSGYILWGVYRYLNKLESILLAWQENVADRSVLEKQFGFVHQQRALPLFRKAIGEDAHPAIASFIEAADRRISEARQQIKAPADAEL